MNRTAVCTCLLHISASSLIPVAVYLAATGKSAVFYLLAAASLLYFVKVMPFCRKRENLWMFFLIFLCSVPVNVSIVRNIPTGAMFFDVFAVYLTYILLITIEEIVMGYITRALWPKQHHLLYYGEDE